MTLSDLMAALDGYDPALALRFRADGQDVLPGYHVTELKLAKIESIDCGGRRSTFSEAALELMDGPGGMGAVPRKAMALGTFQGIARKSMAAIPGLGTAELSIEFGPRGAAKAIYAAGVPQMSATGLLLPLRPKGAQCKPAAGRAAACCGPAEAACC